MVLALLAAVLGWWIGVGRYVDTPRLVGSSETEARTDAKAAGFEFKIAGRAFSETAPNGTVISTDPQPGDKILPGGRIAAVISKGKDRVYLPAELRGMTADEAESALSKLGLKLGELKPKYDEKIAKDEIIKAVDFTAKSALKRGTVVDLYISRGRKPIEVVDYTGRTETEAKAALEGAGFKVAVDSQFSDTVDKGVVISQSPDSGTKFKDATITLTVSKGPDVVKVPDVLGKKKNAAVKILEAAGFKAEPFPGGNYTVESQSPKSGSKQPRGSVVAISQFPF